MDGISLANKLRLIGENVVGYNTFGVVVRINNPGQLGLYKLYIGDKSRLNRNTLGIAYESYGIYDHFIIMMSDTASSSIYINGKGTEVLKNQKYAVPWGYMNNINEYKNGLGAGLGNVRELIGIVNGRGDSKIINYKGKILALDKPKNSWSITRRIVYNNGVYEIHNIELALGRVLESRKVLVLDKDLNILG